MGNNTKNGARTLQNKFDKEEKRETKYIQMNIRVHPQNRQVGRNGRLYPNI